MSQRSALPEKGLWRTGPIFSASNRPLARLVGRPVLAFLRIEAAGGVVLFIATVVALALANSGWSEWYQSVWETEVEFTVGSFHLAADLGHWVNDALMAVFFLVVGLEIKYELVNGQLRDPRSAAVPIAAAVGGMVVPALIYAAFNAGGEGSSGWGVPMATDIAFAVGVMALLGRGVPAPARVFLLTLAIVDDIGAITVIAVFYTQDLALDWLAAAVAGVLALLVLRVLRVWTLPPYLLVGAAVWLATYQSGVHATIAGVALGLLAPAKPLLNRERARELLRDRGPERFDVDEWRRYRFVIGESVSVAERLQHVLHPWSSFLVLPVFALANAGIDLRGGVLAEAAGSPVTVGVALGLLVGKLVGITATSWLMVRLKLGRLPAGMTRLTLLGVAALGGIGFTVAVFIAGLAFPGAPALTGDAKVGILAGSVAAAVGGAVLLRLDAARRHAATRRDAPAGAAA